MKLGLHLSVQAFGRHWPDVLAEAMDDAVLADELGFATVLFAEHHFTEDTWCPQPLTLAAAAAMRTSQAEVGSNIQIGGLMHPAALAENALIIDALSGGRGVIGLGAGWKEADYRGYGLDFSRRFKAFSQHIEVAQALMRGEEVSFEGEFFRSEEARVRIDAVRPGGPPIWLGATYGPQAIRRAARLGDAWVVSSQVRQSDIAEQQQVFRAAREEFGRELPLRRPIRREAFVARTSDEAWKQFAAGIHHEYGLVYRDRHPEYPPDGNWRDLRAWSEGLFIVGSPEEVTEQLLSLRDELGMTDALLRVHLPGVDPADSRRAIELFGEVARDIDDGSWPGRGNGSVNSS